MPPPKSQNQRQFLNRSGIERLLFGVAQKLLPADRIGIDFRGGPLPKDRVAVPCQVHFVNLAEHAGLDNLEPLEELRHAALLHADLNDPLAFVLSADDGCSLGYFVRERFLDIDVLAGLAGVDRHRDMPVIGRSDEHGVDVAAFENLVVVLGGECFGVGDFLGEFQVLLPDVANSPQACAGDCLHRFHQPASTSASADAADVDGFVGRVAEGRRGVTGGGRGRGKKVSSFCGCHGPRL